MTDRKLYLVAQEGQHHWAQMPRWPGWTYTGDAGRENGDVSLHPPLESSCTFLSFFTLSSSCLLIFSPQSHWRRRQINRQHSKLNYLPINQLRRRTTEECMIWLRRYRVFLCRPHRRVLQQRHTRTMRWVRLEKWGWMKDVQAMCAVFLPIVQVRLFFFRVFSTALIIASSFSFFLS